VVFFDVVSGVEHVLLFCGCAGEYWCVCVLSLPVLVCVLVVVYVFGSFWFPFVAGGVWFGDCSVPGGYCDIQCSVHCISLIAVSFISLDGIVCWVVCALCVYFVF